MKCLVVFLITLGLAMSFPHMPINDAARDPEERDPTELENTMTHEKRAVNDFIFRGNAQQKVGGSHNVGQQENNHGNANSGSNFVFEGKSGQNIQGQNNVGQQANNGLGSGRYGKRTLNDFIFRGGAQQNVGGSHNVGQQENNRGNAKSGSNFVFEGNSGQSIQGKHNVGQQANNGLGYSRYGGRSGYYYGK